MSLTLGNGPFARNEAAGESNVTIEAPAHILWFHDVPQRVRATLGGVTVVDTERARLLHETRLLPVYYLPRGDWDAAVLTPSTRTTTCAYKGHDRYLGVRPAGGEEVPDLVWRYDDPLSDGRDVAGLLCAPQEHERVEVEVTRLDGDG